MNTIYKLGFIISFLSISILAFPQNIDEIIKKHIDAHGGAKKWDAIQSMKITGKFTAFSIVKPFVTYKAKPGYYYSEFSLDKYDVVEAFDGKKGWTIDPWQEIDFPRGVNKAETNVFMQQSDFCTPLFNFNKEGYTIELEGKETLEGQEVFKIKVTRPNGYIETWYIDTETYLEFKSESQWIDFAYQLPSEAYYDDFRKVNGVVLPFYIERTFNIRNRITEIENIEFNVDFDKSKLEMQRNPEMEKLEFLEGKWSVNVKVMTRSGAWYPIDSTVSTMNFHEKNILTGHISYDRIFPMGISATYSYNRTSKKYRMTIYNSFGSELDIYEGDFVEENLIFDNVNISFGTDDTKTYVQYVFSYISDAGFVMERKESSDNGITWKARDQFIYKKMIK